MIINFDWRLPDLQMGVGCLLSLREEAWGLLQGMVEHAPSPEHARRALLIGLKASAVKVRPHLGPILCCCLQLTQCKLTPSLQVTAHNACTVVWIDACPELHASCFTVLLLHNQHSGKW